MTHQALLSLTLIAVLASPVARSLGTVERLADDLARSGAQTLAVLGTGASVGVVIRTLDDATRKGTRFTSALKPLLRERLGMARAVIDLGVVAPTVDRNLEPMIELARAKAADRLLVLDVIVLRGYVHAVAQMIEVRRDFWTRVARPVVGVRGQWYARARLDGEVRALLGIPAASLQTLDMRPLFECADSATGARTCWPAGAAIPSSLIASAVLDVDGDAVLDLALIGLDEVWIGRCVRDYGRLEILSLGTIAMPGGREGGQRPMEPFGFAQAADLDRDGSEELVAWTATTRTASVIGTAPSGVGLRRWPSATRSCGAVRAAGSPMSACGPPLAVWEPPATRTPGQAPRAMPPALVTGDVAADAFVLNPQFRFWSMVSDERKFAAPGPLWAWAESESVRDGVRARVTATVDTAGQLAVAGGPKPFVLPNSGSALVLVDLDDDGMPELVRSTDADPGLPDAVVVHSLSDGREIFRRKTATIRAINQGDYDNDGRLDVLVLTASGPFVIAVGTPQS